MTAHLSTRTVNPGRTKLIAEIDDVKMRLGVEATALSVPVIAGLIGCNSKLVYRAIHNGQLRALQIGRRWVVPYDAYIAWLHSDRNLQPH